MIKPQWIHPGIYAHTLYILLCPQSLPPQFSTSRVRASSGILRFLFNPRLHALERPNAVGKDLSCDKHYAKGESGESA